MGRAFQREGRLCTKVRKQTRAWGVWNTKEAGGGICARVICPEPGQGSGFRVRPGRPGVEAMEAGLSPRQWPLGGFLV